MKEVNTLQGEFQKAIKKTQNKPEFVKSADGNFP